MSFAGHVYDMMRRNKEDREALKRLRSRSRDMRERYLGGNYPLPDVSAEELEEIKQQTIEREKGEKNYFFRVKLWILFVALGLLLSVWLIKSLMA